MAISITPQQMQFKTNPLGFFSIKTTGGFVLLASVILFITAILAWVALKGFTAKLYSDTQALSDQITQTKLQRSPQAEADMIAKVTRINNIQKLLETHVNGKKAFTFLEKEAQPEIIFSGLSINYSQSSVVVTVEGPDSSAIAKQFVAFENNPSVVRVIMSGVNRTAQGISGNFNISLKPNAFVTDSK